VRDFNRDNRGGGRGRGGSRFGGRSGGGDRPMHQATCSQCGKDCQVPFRPTGEKPVYCSDCFRERGGNNNRGSYDRNDRNDRSPQNPVQNYQNQFDNLNQKLDAILEALAPKKKAVKKKAAGKKPVAPTKEEKLS